MNCLPFVISIDFEKVDNLISYRVEDVSSVSHETKYIRSLNFNLGKLKVILHQFGVKQILP